MLEIDIPDFGLVQISHLVTDYTGTLSEFGVLVEGVGDLLERISERGVSIHVLTSDTYGTARNSLKDLPVEIEILEGEKHHIQKSRKVEALGKEGVIAIGNGRNDSEMLKTARLGICINLAEGCATEALTKSDLVYNSITAALTCILDGNAVKASLRR